MLVSIRDDVCERRTRLGIYVVLGLEVFASEEWPRLIDAFWEVLPLGENPR